MQDVFGLGRPDKWLWILVVNADVVCDGRFEFGHAGEHTTTQRIHGQGSKESLNPVQPRRRGGRELHVDARMFLKPREHRRAFVGGIVVADQVGVDLFSVSKVPIWIRVLA